VFDFLKGKVPGRSLIVWLLEEENPSVRYLTLRDVLARKEDAPKLQAAKAAIPNSRVVAKILSTQRFSSSRSGLARREMRPLWMIARIRGLPP
jgi:hypothetical protein